MDDIDLIKGTSLVEANPYRAIVRRPPLIYTRTFCPEKPLLQRIIPHMQLSPLNGKTRCARAGRLCKETDPFKEAKPK
eukprot:2745732-Amphidinium_carterae.1